MGIIIKVNGLESFTKFIHFNNKNKIKIILNLLEEQIDQIKIDLIKMDQIKIDQIKIDLIKIDQIKIDFIRQI